MKRVFVTGASSELIRSLLREFPEENYQFIALSRQPRQNESNLNWITGAIDSPKEYSSYLETVDMIIHAAAITHSKDQNKYDEVNVKGTEQLIDAMPKDGTQKFILVSSRAAGNDSGAYGVSKLKAEEVVKRKTGNWLILRPAEVFGGTKREGIDGVIYKALKGGLMPCPIGMRANMYPIHNEDAARAMASAILDHDNDNTTVFVNGPEPLSFVELIKVVEEQSGRKVIAIPIPRPIMKLAMWVGTTLNIDLGFVPDQVDRLYSAKDHAPPSPIRKPIREYVQDCLTDEQ